MRLFLNSLFFIYRAIKNFRAKLMLFYYHYKGAIIGKNTYLGPNVYLDVNHKPGKIVIGSNCYITRNCSILTHSDAFIGGPKKIFQDNGGFSIHGDVTIGDNVFIGFHSVILPNVCIGKDAVIGAMTLVRNDIPDGAIAAGVPAKIVGNIYDKLNKTHIKEAK